ncbi:RNB domain-containing ribonuclease [Pseudonocardiaceae bacterium YIM PH 21723]|nr:RNB domain-containing ribonuclease [Pseudonocardiaceae bacterium YIM PH 21723]
MDFTAIRTEFQLPARFPDDVLADARREPDTAGREDATALPLVTIDPPGAKDLDQAMFIERRDDGYRVHYAIADLGAIVVPGGALDQEVRRRGQTFYLPDGNVPLHPVELSEGASSLLPDQTRPAALWTLDLDATGELTAAHVRRALVRSVARLDYQHAEHPSIALLPEVGELRRKKAVERGAIELRLPEQEAVQIDGELRLVVHPRTPADAWNAEISLLTGMAAAKIMLDAKVGLLRTLPAPEAKAIEELRRSARNLGADWPEGATAAQVLDRLDPAQPAALALYTDATRLLRGAAYTAFDGALPDQRVHGGIGAPYAHVTAPLRRLVDRYGAEICLAICAGEPVPDWVRQALPELPKVMEVSDGLAAKVERACLDLAEATVLASNIGMDFDAVVLRSGNGKGEIFIEDPAVLATCTGELPEGERITARLVTADPATRTVSFQRV